MSKFVPLFPGEKVIEGKNKTKALFDEQPITADAKSKPVLLFPDEKPVEKAIADPHATAQKFREAMQTQISSVPATRTKGEVSPLFNDENVIYRPDWDAIFSHIDFSKYDLGQTEVVNVKRIARQIDYRQPDFVLKFGLSLQKKMADFTDKILDSLKHIDGAKIDTIMKKIVELLKELDIEDLGGGKSFFGLFNKNESFKDQFERISGETIKASASLAKEHDGLIASLHAMTLLYQENFNNFEELKRHIAAGDIVLDELKNKAIPKIQAEVTTSRDLIKHQELEDLKNAADRLDKKLTDLRAMQISALQSVKQIKLMEQTNQLRAQKIQSLAMVVIPLWKKQFIAAISLLNSKNASESQTAIQKAVEYHKTMIQDVESSIAA